MLRNGSTSNNLLDILNSSEYIWDYSYEYPEIAMSADWQTVLTTAFTFTMVLSITGNALVMVVLLCGKSGRGDLNIFIVNLAVADLSMAVLSMPFTFTTLMYGHWIFGAAMCPVMLFAQQVSVCVSIYTLTVIGINRYFAVMYPLKIGWTKNRNRIFVLSVWVVSVILSIVPPIVGYTKEEHWDGNTIFLCAEWWSNETSSAIYELFVMCITYFIPLVLLSYTYISIGRRLWGRRIPGNADHNRDRTQKRAKRQVIKMLLVVLMMFAFCWLPLHIFNIVQRVNPHLLQQDTTRMVNAGVLWLAMSNSCVNPVIYSFLNDNFKRNLVMLCGCSRNCPNTANLGRSKGQSLATTTIILKGKSTTYSEPSIEQLSMEESV
ncbi:QRFP-like peptide receptor [Saccoglossus kowalevskii]|uniref:Substance-P receptor-like n=1 Tax=Saccoglossus kowalevskii TaxID=10224 RepID=A0ABM0GWC8_SACKO|nr:PREDICTED: substance-P receptor-like [Saccoglossus kowalevskii]